MAKSKPHTIRFEEEDFNFICKRENLKTAQGIISFLMDNYIKLYKVEKQSIFIAEPQKEYDAPRLPISTQDEPKKWQEAPINQFDAYKKEFLESTSYVDLYFGVTLMKKDKSLNFRQISELELIAAKVKEQKGFIFND